MSVRRVLSRGERVVNCRICAATARLWADRGDVALFHCGRCGFVSGEPRQALTAVDRYQNYHAEPAAPAPEARYRQWLARAETSVGPGHLLEVGAGTGGLVRIALSRGWKVDATEVSESGLRALRETGATVFAGDLAAAQYGTAQFDLVVSLEVLEHLPAPLSHLREMGRVTRPGGLLILTTPNFQGLSRRLLGMRWRVIDPEHLGYFTPTILSRLLHEVGYTTVRVTSRSLDVLSWRRGCGPMGIALFDPHASARLRDTVEDSRILRLGKSMVDAMLRASGLGDSLLAWARR
jgi:SAM-dependent methyltransferase